jgi:4-amino-4-deoxy-L-arabinose transferase-like glycosyltransferase
MFDVLGYLKDLKKYFTRRDILIVLVIIGLYFLTRLIRLDSFPIFSDEGIYIHWAKVAWHDANWRFISLTDGRQPLQTCMTIPFLKFFPENLLLGGRLFGVLSGFIGLSGLFLTVNYIFNKRTAYIASLIFIFTPYLLFSDRLAMIDSFVDASAIWIFFFSVILVQTLRLDIALLFGLFSGMALLAKSSVSMFMRLATT